MNGTSKGFPSGSHESNLNKKQKATIQGKLCLVAFCVYRIHDTYDDTFLLTITNTPLHDK